MLEPLYESPTHEGFWRYRCRMLKYEDGKAVCTFRKYRPRMCKGFPNYRKGECRSKRDKNGIKSLYPDCAYVQPKVKNVKKKDEKKDR